MRFRDKLRIPSGGCYACDSERTVGVRDRRPEGGHLEPACRRHADPTIEAVHACAVCDGPLRKGSRDTGMGLFFHVACERAVSV